MTGMQAPIPGTSAPFPPPSGAATPRGGPGAVRHSRACHAKRPDFEGAETRRGGAV